MKYTISFKNKTNLIKKLLDENIFTELKKASVFGKFLKKKEFADIYFHSGLVEKDTLEIINNSKLTITNSNSSKNLLINKYNIEESKLQVFYPSFDIVKLDKTVVKKEIFEEFNIEENFKTFFFTAKNFKTSGVYDFLNIVNFLNYKNFKAVVFGDKKEISNLKFQISRHEVKDKIILIEDYNEVDKLFIAFDIFLLPTSNKSFSSNILKAMIYECAVFTTVKNDASELVDVFSTMESPSDRSTQFKLDALLHNDDELNKIKKQNYLSVQEYTLENQLEKLKRFNT